MTKERERAGDVVLLSLATSRISPRRPRTAAWLGFRGLSKQAGGLYGVA